jgi:predicted nuclease of predicted toxin-antitoxin system
VLPLLLDENFNRRILRGLSRRIPDLDYLVVQSAGLGGESDRNILAWAAEHSRVLVTHDLKTIPLFAYTRIVASLPMSGVIAVNDELAIGQVIEELAIIVTCSETSDWENQVVYLPL